MVSRVLEGYSNVRFVIVGEAYPKELLEELLSVCTERKIQDQVHFLGQRQDVPKLLRTSDVFVLPSIVHEAFPWVILEAMAANIPVIATDVGGIKKWYLMVLQDYLFLQKI